MEQSPDILLLVAALTIAVAVLAVAVGLTRSILAKRKAQSATAGAGKIEYRRLLRGQLDKIAFNYVYYPAASKIPPSFLIFLPWDGPLTFAIRREGRVERLFKRLGVNRETQVGHRGFDDRFYIVTDQEEATRRHLFSARQRQAVERLFELGVSEVRVTQGRVQASILPFQGRAPLAREWLRQAVEALLILRDGLPSAHPGEPNWTLETLPEAPTDNPFRGPWTSRRTFAYGLALLLFIGGVVAFPAGVIFYPPLDDQEFFLAGLGPAIPALLLFVGLAVALLRGRADSHKDLLLVLFFGLIGTPLCGYGGLALLNGLLDSGAPSQHVALVTQKYTSKSKNDTHYHLRLASWRRPGQEEHIKVNEPTYDALTPGHDRLLLTTRPGRLGLEWVVGYALGP
jgi:hypothetical protein